MKVKLTFLLRINPSCEDNKEPVAGCLLWTLAAQRPNGRVSTQRMDGCEFKSRPSQTKDSKSETQFFPA